MFCCVATVASKKVYQGGIVTKINVFFFGTIFWFEHWFHIDLCKIFWVYFCILYDIDNKLGLFKKLGFIHFPINKMFMALMGWGPMKHDLFARCFNIPQKRKEKLANERIDP